MTEFTFKTRCHGDPEGVRNKARTLLEFSGFTISNRGHHNLTATRKVGRLSTKEDPLVFVSGLELTIQNNECRLKAECKHIRKLIVFLIVFLILLMLGLSVTLGMTEGWGKVWLTALPFAPWPILLPVIVLSVKHRVRKRLEQLLETIARTEDSGQPE